MDCPGVEARQCLPDGGARVCPPVQAWVWAVRVHLALPESRALRERRHGLALQAEMERLRG